MTDHPVSAASLEEYRRSLELVQGGTIPVALALEIIDQAEEEIETRAVALTLQEAMDVSGRSRSFFERRLAGWLRDGTARKRGGRWFIDRAVVPYRSGKPREGFDPSMPTDQIADRLLA